jgi:hypothetical protein
VAAPTLNSEAVEEMTRNHLPWVVHRGEIINPIPFLQQPQVMQQLGVDIRRAGYI